MLKLASINIEGDNHLLTVDSCIQAEQPDVVCLQELFESDASMLAKQWGMEYFFAPMSTLRKSNNFRLSPRGSFGLGVFSKLPFQRSQSIYYAPISQSLPELVDGQPNNANRVLICATVTKDDQFFTIATTHFTWTPGGSVTDLQRDHLTKLLNVLDSLPEVVLCGDFNAPRGKEIFDTLASHYTDNIPIDVTTTIDQNLHRVPGLQFVVDALFSSNHYKATNVRVIDGVSDHCAVVGEIEKNTTEEFSIL